ncbi:phage holin family protein [Morganella morganii]|uniref:phage holin family protein n=2 Tax=Enterobacterales TaxID=91347 RepID=UPI00191E94B2|nr:phage holin family protein [Morganella morganii]ELA7709597.1 phage holin family protein [Morganella morganii]ELA7735621.1 phage holin family protein [Morganella morganii]ELA7737489.1 phage holin family protein [Morganella morganii]MBT0308764.1 phage holin family protein [Morganella morganii subsp. morganii]QQU42008.1 phage holin family protein [Morganella morganii]
MTDQERPQGPGKGLLDTLTRITAIVISMAETRLRLVATELEEEKSNLIQLILLAGAALLLTAFGLMSLMILVMWAVDPVYRLTAMIIMTSVLLVGALIFALWAVRKARHSSLLGATREQLAIDRQLLERKKQEQDHE